MALEKINDGWYEMDTITFQHLKKLIPGLTEAQFKAKTGRDPEIIPPHIKKPKKVVEEKVVEKKEAKKE